MTDLIITVATTGSGTPLSRNSHLAVTPKQVSDEVYECYKAGASIAHIHVREDDGARSMSFEKFKETAERIREKCDIIINFTTSGMEFDEDVRLKPLILKPELASFNAGSMNFNTGIFINSFDFMRTLAKTMRENGVKPEIEVYDSAMIRNSLFLREEGVLAEPMHFQFVLGVKGGMAATPSNLMFLKDNLPAGATWSALGIGSGSTAISSMAIHMGGHVRAGMEDNIYIRKGVLAKNNVEFIEKLKRLAGEFERPIASVDTACKILGLRGYKK